MGIERTGREHLVPDGTQPLKWSGYPLLLKIRVDSRSFVVQTPVWFRLRRVRLSNLAYFSFDMISMTELINSPL